MAKTSGSDKLEADTVLEYAAPNDPVLRAKVEGDAFERFRIEADGTILTGTGVAAPATDGAPGANAKINLKDYGAVSGAANITTSFQAAVDAAVAAGSTLFIPYGTWNWSTLVQANGPLTIEIDPLAVMHPNDSMTSGALLMGADGLTAPTVDLNLYCVKGGIWKGGAAAAYGIRFNKYIARARVQDTYCYGCTTGSGSYFIDFYDENWDAAVIGSYAYSGAGTLNWVRAVANGGINSTRLRVIECSAAGNGTGTGVRLNGAHSEVAHSKIESFGPNVALGPLANHSVIHNNYFEAISATGTGCISYGDTAVVLDGLVIEGNFVNLHKSDYSRDNSVLYPIHASSGLKNCVIERNNFTDQGTAPIVKMNTAVAGQTPNTARDNAGYTGTFVTASVTGGGSNWSGTKSGLIQDPNWVDVATGVGFTNSWLNAGGSPAASYRFTPDGRHVELVGGVNGGNSGDSVFTLPAAYRPLTLMSLVGQNFADLVPLTILIGTDGTVKPYGGSAVKNQRIDGVFAIDI